MRTSEYRKLEAERAARRRRPPRVVRFVDGEPWGGRDVRAMVEGEFRDAKGKRGRG